MKKLVDIARAAQNREEQAASKTNALHDHVAFLWARLHQALEGFDYEIEAVGEDCFAVGIRHPHRNNAWLAFVVSQFGPGDEPIWPAQGREIRIRAGQVFERSVYLPLTALEYIAQNEQE